MPSHPQDFRILIAHGVNLDLLGRREPHIYGRQTLAELNAIIAAKARGIAAALNVKVHLTFVQTNDEHAFLRAFDGDYSGSVINPAAWTHTSLALADRLVGLGMPYVEVHLTDTKNRESFRGFSYIEARALRVCSGQGVNSYVAGLEALLIHLVGQGPRT